MFLFDIKVIKNNTIIITHFFLKADCGGERDPAGGCFNLFRALDGLHNRISIEDIFPPLAVSS